jgi:hypothetical protein
MALDEHELLATAYREFNRRNIEAVLAMMHPDVKWANGMEGGHVVGREAVRAYWTRQFLTLDPQVEPVGIERDTEGRFVVRVHQVVRDRDGKLLVDTFVLHAYRIRDKLIQQMDIEPATGGIE